MERAAEIAVQYQQAVAEDAAEQVAEGEDPGRLSPQVRALLARHTCPSCGTVPAPTSEGATMRLFRKNQTDETVRDFGTDTAALERHARQLATTEALERMDAYKAEHGQAWVDSDHRSVNR